MIFFSVNEWNNFPLNFIEFSLILNNLHEERFIKIILRVLFYFIFGFIHYWNYKDLIIFYKVLVSLILLII
jgi:hypothetical protein